MSIDRILRRKQLEKELGLSRSTIYLRMKQGSFPKPIPLGGRLVGWKASDIQAWIEERIKESEQPA